jgi:Tfp pilus assembly protein PilN
MYSYKAPRKKPLFSRDSLLWMIFVGIVTAALVAFGLYLYVKSSAYEEKLKEVEASNKVLSQSVISYEKEMKILKMQEVLAKEIKSSNELLKNSIKNLFDLVPDQIVLTKVVMQKDFLDLEGTTPTKDTYRLLLEPPLKSIFNSSKVNFKFNGFIGKYEFKSLNSISDEGIEAQDGKNKK